MAPAKPTNASRLDDVEHRLDAIDRALGIQPTTPKIWFGKKAWQGILENKKSNITIAMLSLLIGFLAIPAGVFGPHWVEHKADSQNALVDDRIKLVLNTPGGISQSLRDLVLDVNAVKTKLDTLQPFIQALLLRRLEDVSQLTDKQLSNRLPAVKDLLGAAKEQNVPVSPDVAGFIGKKLLNVDTQTSDYWTVAGGLLKYHASVSSQPLPPELEAIPKIPNVGDCFSRPMSYGTKNGLLGSSSNAHKYLISHVTYHDCTLRIDNVMGFFESETVKHYQNDSDTEAFRVVLTLLRVVVVYRGGPLIPVSILNSFGCSFDFEVPQSPSAPAQKLVRGILASDFTKANLTLNILSPG